MTVLILFSAGTSEAIIGISSKFLPCFSRSQAMDYTISLQKYQDIRYNRLYIADVNDLFVCNLDDSIGAGYRLSRYPITREQRKAFFHEAIQKQQSTTE